MSLLHVMGVYGRMVYKEGFVAQEKRHQRTANSLISNSFSQPDPLNNLPHLLLSIKPLIPSQPTPQLQNVHLNPHHPPLHRPGLLRRHLPLPAPKHARMDLPRRHRQHQSVIRRRRVLQRRFLEYAVHPGRPRYTCHHHYRA
jgi:hypothetical protein